MWIVAIGVVCNTLSRRRKRSLWFELRGGIELDILAACFNAERKGREAILGFAEFVALFYAECKLATRYLRQPNNQFTTTNLSISHFIKASINIFQSVLNVDDFGHMKQPVLKEPF
jgi:hypothetical protein